MMKKYISIVLFFFSLSIVEVYGQSDTSTYSINSKQLLDNFDLNNSVKMYPNPVGRFLIVESKISVTKVQIFSLLGTQVKEVKSNFKSIYLGELKSGIYMIKIYAGNVSTTKKLVKK